MTRSAAISRKKPATLKDVAEAAGVSLSTVSRALNDLYQGIGGSGATAERIKKLAREMGYQPHAHATALALRNAKSDTVGVLVSGGGQWAFHPMLNACYHELNEAGKIMSLAPMPGHDSKPQSIRMLKTTGLDGIVVAYAPPPWLRQELSSMRLPMVWVNADDRVPVNNFYYDDTRGGRIAAEYLISLGHRRIQYFNASMDTHCSVRRRFLGYGQALRAAGLNVPDGAGQFLEPEEHAAWMGRHLSGPNAATAVICYTTWLAQQVLLWAYRAHLRIPDDLNIIDLGGHGEALATTPPLTEVHLPRENIVRSAIRHLLNMIEGKAADMAPQCFKPDLVVRESTCKLDPQRE
jgi:DNA-binding LacI/PurR family transcriptional regulator